jgi:hypothetical protein
MHASEATVESRGVSQAALKSPAALLARSFGRLFGCRHSDMGRPVTLGGETYCVCLDCGARRRFDTDGWKMFGPYYF